MIHYVAPVKRLLFNTKLVTIRWGTWTKIFFFVCESSSGFWSADCMMIRVTHLYQYANTFTSGTSQHQDLFRLIVRRSVHQPRMPALPNSRAYPQSHTRTARYTGEVVFYNPLCSRNRSMTHHSVWLMRRAPHKWGMAHTTPFWHGINLYLWHFFFKLR